MAQASPTILSLSRCNYDLYDSPSIRQMIKIVANLFSFLPIYYFNSSHFIHRYGSEEGMVGVDRNVVVPHFHHCKYQNCWLKYNHRVMYKKYTTSLPPMGCEAVERHLEMAQPTRKLSRQFGKFIFTFNIRLFHTEPES